MIFVCGDTHGRPYDTDKISRKKWKEQRELTKEDILIQLGDFGWVWYEFGENSEQEYWLDHLAERNFTLAVIPGNHENYDIIEKLPIKEMWGGPVRVLERKKGEIYFLERGHVYEMQGKKIFAFGGAQSNTRPDNHVEAPQNPYGYSKKSKTPVEGKDWWAREIPSKEEFERGKASLEAHGWEVDYVLTHTCPTSIVKKLKEDGENFKYLKWVPDNDVRTDDPVSIYLEEINDRVKFRYWAFAHFHMDHTIEFEGNTYLCFYRDNPLELTTF